MDIVTFTITIISVLIGIVGAITVIKLIISFQDYCHEKTIEEIRKNKRTTLYTTQRNEDK